MKSILDGLPPTYRPRGWGKDEITISLGTADKRKIGAEHARVMAAVTARFEALRAGVRTLSHKEVVALSGVIYRGFAEGGEDDPGSADQWRQALELTVRARRGLDTPGLAIDPSPAEARALGLAFRFGPMADALCAAEGLIIDVASRDALIRELGRATDDAASKLLRNAEGDYRPDAAADRFPEWVRPSQTSSKQASRMPLRDLFERWAQHREQAEQAPRTKQRYRGVFAAVAAFLGDPDASSVTTADLQRYVEARMSDAAERPLAPRVARDVHRAALSSVYGWAVAKGIVKGNPAEGVFVKVSKGRKLRADELSDSETRALVAAALAIPATEAPGTLNAAKRWCAMLCLYTGSRIGELTQLRKEDVLLDSAPAIRITPEAGTVKDRELRLVPLHPRLIDLGFLGFVERAPLGPLFYDPARKRRGSQTPAYEQVAKDIAAWSRQVGLDDVRLKRPLHAVRHRFMTSARRAGVEEQYVQAIAGHSPGTRNRSYGSFPLSILHREVVRLAPAAVEGEA